MAASSAGQTAHAAEGDVAADKAVTLAEAVIFRCARWRPQHTIKLSWML